MTHRYVRLVGLVLLVALGVGLIYRGDSPAEAQVADGPVLLGAADSFAVLAGQTVTNTGPSVVTGDLGVSPGSAVTGFPPGIVVDGDIHAADTLAAEAQSDLTDAYNDAAGRAPTAAIAGDLGGLTLTTGVYSASSSIGITGTLTLDAQDDPDAVWIFQIGTTLTTASGSTVSLINGANPCNVFWQIGSSTANLGTDSTFAGTILALTSITAATGTDVEGRLLSRNGSVTLDTNTITNSCEPPVTTTTIPVTTPTTIPGAAPPPVPAATLPRTGNNLAPLALAGLLTVALGAALVVEARRRNVARTTS
jgi:hypothetical protein